MGTMAASTTAISTGRAWRTARGIIALLVEDISALSLSSLLVQALVLLPFSLLLITRLRTSTVAHFAPSDLFLSLLLTLLLWLAVLVLLFVVIAVGGAPARA